LTRRAGTTPGRDTAAFGLGVARCSLESVDQSLSDPSLYLNRELSWLDFNDRVLQLAEDERVPLLERVKFCAIYTTNLDEYYMVRVAGLRDQIDAGVENPSQDGLLPSEVIALIRERVLAQSRRLTDCFEGHLRPALGTHDIRVVGVRELDDERRAELAKHFQKAIFPALTPLAVAPGRPFPYISNLSLSLAVLVRDPTNAQTVFARVKVPTEILPRFVTLKQPAPEPALLVPLEDVIANHLDALFPGMEIADYDVFRVTRDADLEVSDDAADLLQAVEDELRRRRFGEVVRVEIGAHCSEQLREALQGLLGVQDDEVYPVDGLLDMGALWQIVKLPGHNELREEPIVASRTRACCVARASAPTCSARCAKATCWCTTRTCPSPPRSSASSSRPSPTRTCWRSSRPSIAQATTRRWCRR